DNVVARTSLAKLLVKQGQSQEAERLYRDVLERDPRNEYAQAGLRRLGLQEQGEDSLPPAPQPEPDTRPHGLALTAPHEVSESTGGSEAKAAEGDEGKQAIGRPGVIAPRHDPAEVRTPSLPASRLPPTERREASVSPVTSPAQEAPSLSRSEIEILV